MNKATDLTVVWSRVWSGFYVDGNVHLGIVRDGREAVLQDDSKFKFGVSFMITFRIFSRVIFDYVLTTLVTRHHLGGLLVEYCFGDTSFSSSQLCDSLDERKQRSCTYSLVHKRLWYAAQTLVVFSS